MSQQQITRYDEYAAHHEAAYAAFYKIFSSKTPPPERQIVKSENRATVGVLAALVIASVLVSGSRTIVEFGGGVIGVAGFVMLELGIVSYAYIRTRIDYNEERHGHVKKLINRGLWLAFAVAVVANLHHTLKMQGFDWQPLNFSIAVMLGISAPVLAFISGDIAGMLSAVDAVRQRRADKEYNDAMVAWREELNSSWAREKSRWNVKIETVSSPAIEAQSGANSHVHSVNSVNEYGEQSDTQPYSANSANGYSKRMDARSVIREYFDRNPAMLTARLDELVPAIEAQSGAKVGRTSVHNVRKEILSSKQE